MPKGKAGSAPIKPYEMSSVCGAVRTWYMGNKTIPTLEELDAICDISKVRIATVLKSDQFLMAMDETGIPFRKAKGLNGHQHFALMILTDPNDKRPFHERLKQIGVTSTMYRAWLKNPIFASFLTTFMNNALQDHETAAHLSLMNKVDRGDVRALELYYAMTGIYDPQSRQERDIQTVLTAVVEIIQRNVTDQSVLANIAEEIQTLMGGKRKPALPAYRSEQVEDAVIIKDEYGEGVVPDPTGPLVDFEYVEEPMYSPHETNTRRTGQLSFEEKLAFLEEGKATPDQTYQLPKFDIH